MQVLDESGNPVPTGWFLRHAAENSVALFTDEGEEAAENVFGVDAGMFPERASGRGLDNVIRRYVEDLDSSEFDRRLNALRNWEQTVPASSAGYIPEGFDLSDRDAVRELVFRSGQQGLADNERRLRIGDEAYFAERAADISARDQVEREYDALEELARRREARAASNWRILSEGIDPIDDLEGGVIDIDSVRAGFEERAAAGEDPDVLRRELGQSLRAMLGVSDAERERAAGSWLSDRVGSDEFGLSGEARELGVWAARAVESGALSSVGGQMVVDPDKVGTARDWASLTVLSLLSGQDAGTSAVDLIVDGEAANRGWYADQWGIPHLESGGGNVTAEYRERSAKMAANVAALLGIPLPSGIREFLYGSEADRQAPFQANEDFDRNEFINAEWADFQAEVGDEGSAQWQEAFDDLALLVAGEMHYWNASREGLASRGAALPDNLVNEYQAGQVARIVAEEFELLEGSDVGDREAWSQILGSMQGLATGEVRRADAQALSNLTTARRPGMREPFPTDVAVAQPQTAEAQARSLLGRQGVGAEDAIRSVLERLAPPAAPLPPRTPGRGSGLGSAYNRELDLAGPAGVTQADRLAAVGAAERDLVDVFVGLDSDAERQELLVRLLEQVLPTGPMVERESDRYLQILAEEAARQSGGR